MVATTALGEELLSFAVGIPIKQDTINMYTYVISAHKKRWMIGTLSKDLQKRQIVLLLDNCHANLVIKNLKAITCMFLSCHVRVSE